MEIAAEYRDAIVEHALEEDPNECCGILAGVQGIIKKHYRITNAEKSPYRYSLDGKEFLEALREIDDRGWEIQVFYHSHTHSPAYPSATDVRLATWPDAYYLLVSLLDKSAPEIRLFSILDGEVSEKQVDIT